MVTPEGTEFDVQPGVAMGGPTQIAWAGFFVHMHRDLGEGKLSPLSVPFHHLPIFKTCTL